MKLALRNAPHIRAASSNVTVMGDAVLALAALYFIAAFYYGMRAVSLGIFGIIVSCLADLICVKLSGHFFSIRDLSPVVTGMIIPLMMPASIPYSVVLTACVFAICVAKQPFGGLGNNLFNPAAAGVAFAITCWSTRMFAYPAAFSALEPLGEVTAALQSSGAYSLYMGGAPAADFSSILLGIVPGPMGTTNALVILACLLYLAARGTVRLTQPLLCLFTVGVLAMMFPRAPVGSVSSALYELLCTPVVFCAVFMLTDPVTSPKRLLAKNLYAVACGLVIMLFAWLGGYEQTIAFAVLFMNALVPAFDIAAEHLVIKERRRHGGPERKERCEDGAEDD